jgi:TRAP-type transport system periplasmic protein
MRRTFLKLALLAAATALTSPAMAQLKWDMPTPYSDGTFQTQNVRAFTADVEAATAKKITITVHSNASLVKMPEMRRAVATGQVQIGELLISVLGNEDAMFAFDSTPGLATSYADARKLYGAARKHLESRLEKSGLMMLYSVAIPRSRSRSWPTSRAPSSAASIRPPPALPISSAHPLSPSRCPRSRRPSAPACSTP